MSVAIHTIDGEGISLDEILAGNLTLDLWSAGPNSNTPSKADTAGQYTLISSNGITSKTLTGGTSNWTKSGSNPTVAQYNVVQVFTATGPVGPAVGWTLRRPSDGKLRYVFKFDTAWSAVVSGDHIDVTVKISQK